MFIIKKIALALIISISIIFSGLPALAQTKTHKVIKGDTLWFISQKYATTVDEIKRLNKMTTNTIAIGQELIVIESATETITKPYVSYSVAKGDTLGKIAEYFGITAASIRSLNGISGDIIYQGSTLKIPADYKEHIVVPGDTLYKLSKTYNVSIDKIKMYSNITFDDLRVAMILKIPGKGATATPPVTPSTPQQPTITYKFHKVVSGDNSWKVSVKYGIPMAEFLKVNGLNMESVLNIGQTVNIPVHNIPIKPTPGAKYGEYLDWWTEAQYVIPINKTVKVRDFTTNKEFTVKRTIGANHADCEPLTIADTNIAKSLWGGFSWITRPVIILVDGRKIAASMSFYPHDIEYIADNGFNGHFDIHFPGSTRHKDGKTDHDHQAKIKTAAGK